MCSLPYLLECPHGEVHGANSEEGQGVDSDHDDEEEDVEENPGDILGHIRTVLTTSGDRLDFVIFHDI